MAKGEEKPPGSEVLAAFQSSLAEPRTLRKVLGFARKRAFLLRRFGVGVDLEADDLVDQVVVDTATGVLTWNPEKVAHSTHLCGAIRSRTAKLIQRRPAAPQDVIDEVVARGNAGEVDPVGVVVGLRDVVGKVRNYLFQVANTKGDEHVQFLLMAYEQGVEGRSAIGEATGLTPTEVTNARKRLGRYIRDMPPGLAEDARKAMN